MTRDAPVSLPRPMTGTVKPSRTRQRVRARRDSHARRRQRVAKASLPRITGHQLSAELDYSTFIEPPHKTLNYAVRSRRPFLRPARSSRMILWVGGPAR
jgi:hypothetical protein